MPFVRRKAKPDKWRGFRAVILITGNAKRFRESTGGKQMIIKDRIVC